MGEDASTLQGRREITADAVVIGAGAGGAACAYRLASRGLKVVVLEEGHRYTPRNFPASYGWALNHIYAEKGARHVEGEALYPMPAGRGVGGSTLINSAICFRAPDHVLERWVTELGLEGLSAEKMKPLYDFVSETIGVTETHPSLARLNNLAIKRGAERLGMEGAFIHRNAPGCVGCGVCQLGCPSGGKGSVDRNFVPMAEELGAVFYADCKVQEILLQKGRAAGIEATVHDSETGVQVGALKVSSERVILSAGTVGTVLLLLRQKLANASGQVGKNLCIHPAVGTFGFGSEVIDGWDGVPQAYAVFLDRKEGILLQTYNANPEIFFSTQPWSGLDGMAKLRRLRNLAMCGGMASDHPGGTITLGRGGRATVRYDLHDLDRKKLIRALRAICSILFAAGANEVFPGIGAGDVWVRDERAAHAILHDAVPERDLPIYASHPMGTCRMGLDPRTSVAGPSGETHDVPGLYIADASLMPSSLGVNPQLTVMSFGLLVGSAVRA